MRKFVAKYGEACLNYLYYQTASGRKPGMLHSIEKVAVTFHTIHLYHVEPSVRNKNKNT